VAQDWSSSPLQVVSGMFETRSQEPDWEARCKQHFAKELEQPGVKEKVPSLNQVANHELCDGQLVRFRCFVQDMFDPEFYLGQYRVKSLADGSVQERTGRYRDVVTCGPREEIMEATDGDTRDRLSYYCVSIPGEAPWVVEQYRRGTNPEGEEAIPGPSGVKTNPLKRGLEMEEEGMDTMETSSDIPVTMETEIKKPKPTNETIDEEFKKPDGVDGPAGVSKSNKMSLNLPLPNRHGKAAIIKLYDITEGDIKLNDILEVVGIVSLDPSLAGSEDEEDDGMGFSSSPSVPPPSLVPRLHVLNYKVLQHNNPLPLEPAPSVTEASQIRSELMAILTEALLGDKLAAEYLLCHLVSGVYLRRDVLVLGKFSLNLHNMTQHDNWPRRLATVLSLLTTASHFMPLTRPNLDAVSFLPKKDFEANRLVSGMLQLPKSTHLMLDETAMTDGQLSAQGLANLTALGNLITWQKAEYDFKYQKMEYDMDIPCLVMSEGRSMLPSDVQLMLKPDCAATPDIISTKFSGIGSYLTSSLLTRIRTYITQCREATFSLTEEVMKAVQDDFVAMRQSAAGITVEDFHSLLVLARLVSKSSGRTSLTTEDWEKSKAMEAERRERVANLPARGGTNFANGMPMHL